MRSQRKGKAEGFADTLASGQVQVRNLPANVSNPINTGPTSEECPTAGLAEIRPHASLPTDGKQLFIHYGSRQAQQAQGRRFIDLAVDRLGNNPDFLLSREELARAAASGVALAG